MNIRTKKTGAWTALLALGAGGLMAAQAANVLQTFCVPLPEDEMQISLNAIDAYRGNVGDEMQSAITRMAGTDGTIDECQAGTPMSPTAKFSLRCRHPAHQGNGTNRSVRLDC